MKEILILLGLLIFSTLMMRGLVKLSEWQAKRKWMKDTLIFLGILFSILPAIYFTLKLIIWWTEKMEGKWVKITNFGYYLV